MEKNKMKVLALALIIFGSAPLAYAGYSDSVQDDSGMMPGPSEMKTRSKEGTVTLVNAGMIKVKDSNGKEMTAAIEPDTSTAWKNGKEVSWDQIKQGKEVNVEFMDMNGAKTVKTVQCL